MILYGCKGRRLFPIVSAISRCDPSREKAILENPQIFQNCKYKNKFPLKMARAHAAAIQNRALPGIQTPRAVLEWSKQVKRLVSVCTL